MRRGLLLLLPATLLVASSCRAPTQITLSLSTDVDCETVRRNEAVIFGGDPKTEPAITATGSCTPRDGRGDVGTIVLAPSGPKDDKISVAVVLGVDVRADGCAANDYRGCIVAKRRVRYVPHEPIEMPIELSRSCIGLVCDPESTCFRGGCISANVDLVDGCLGPECAAPPSTTPPVTDASVDRDMSDGDGAPSAGIPTISLFTAQGELAHGLSVDQGRLYWSMGYPVSAGLIPFHYVALSDPATILESDWATSGKFFGIAARNGVVAFATADQPNCGMFGTGPAQTTILFCGAGAAPPFGAAWSASNELWIVSQPQTGTARHATVFSDTGIAKREVPISGYYAEHVGGTLYVASGTEVLATEPPLASVAGFSFPAPLATYGLAVTDTHVFASSREGKIVVASRSVPHEYRTLVEAGTFSAAEDLVYDGGTLYIAGTKDAVPAIYRITGFGALLP